MSGEKIPIEVWRRALTGGLGFRAAGSNPSANDGKRKSAGGVMSVMDEEELHKMIYKAVHARVIAATSMTEKLANAIWLGAEDAARAVRKTEVAP